jgi:hypothetical protein
VSRPLRCGTRRCLASPQWRAATDNQHRPVSWSPRSGRFDRSGRSTTAGRRAPAARHRPLEQRRLEERLEAHAPAPPWQPPEARRAPKVLAVQHHDVAPLWPRANSSLPRRAPVPTTAGAGPRPPRIWAPPTRAPRSQPARPPEPRRRPRAALPAAAPRGIGTSSSPMITVQLLPRGAAQVAAHHCRRSSPLADQPARSGTQTRRARRHCRPGGATTSKSPWTGGGAKRAQADERP